MTIKNKIIDGRFSISKLEVVIIIYAILIFHIIFITFPSCYVNRYDSIRRILELIMIIILFPFYKIFINKKYLKYNCSLLLFLFFSILSDYINRNILPTEKTLVVGCMYSMEILELSLFCEILHKKNKMEYGIKVLYKITLFYCILSDLLMIINPIRVVTPKNVTIDYFLVGGKFSLCYLHILLLSLYCTVYQKELFKRKYSLLVLFLLSLVVAYKSECSTAILGFVFGLFLFINRKKFSRLCSKPIYLVAFILLCNFILLIGYSLLINNPITQQILNLLGEDPTLTNRENIFKDMYAAINQSPIWGYGFGNNNYISVLFTGAEDVQNGIFDCLLSYGIVGTILLFLYSIKSIKNGSTNSVYLYIGLYIFILFTMVEITFRNQFFILIALIAFNNIPNRTINNNGNKINGEII